jgi:Arrestin (or S-antigen), N-terminal domain
MANEIRIQPPVETLVRGQTVAVPIVLVLEKRLKARGIHAKFLGAEETKAVYTTTSTDGKGNVTTHTHTAVQQVEITAHEHLLAGNEKMGFFGNMSDAMATVFGAGKHDTLEPGEHEFNVAISIPEHAPATHAGQKTRVFYELSIHVDVPAGFDLKATQSFHVEPLLIGQCETTPVRTRYPDDAGRGLFDSLASPDVQIEMALVADKYQSHEMIEGIFTIEPKTSLNCRRILVQLIGIETSEAHGHKDRHIYKGDSVDLGDAGTVSGIYSQDFSLPAKIAAPATVAGEKFSIEWFVQVQLDVPWAKDPKIRTPIVLLP